MYQTSQLLRSEANRLINLAGRLQAFADELESEGAPTPNVNGHVDSTPSGEYANLRQPDAILKALKKGPQTTRELFQRLNSAGQSFKKVTYITAVLGRLKDKVERTDDGKVKLRAETAD